MSMDPEVLNCQDRADMAYETPAEPERHCEECSTCADLTLVDDGAGGLWLCEFHLLRSSTIPCAAIGSGCENYVFTDVAPRRKCFVCMRVFCDACLHRKVYKRDAKPGHFCAECLEKGI